MSLADHFHGLLSGAQGAWDRFNNNTFADAAMAAAALVGYADGTLDAAEKSKVSKAIGGVKELQAFDSADLRKRFDDFCVKAQDEFLRNECLKAIGKLKGNEEAANGVLFIATKVAEASNGIGKEEKDVLAEICVRLGLDPAKFQQAA